ncbi:hypothetical protein V2J09_021867, partial [Rumex salicifolius]
FEVVCVGQTNSRTTSLLLVIVGNANATIQLLLHQFSSTTGRGNWVKMTDQKSWLWKRKSSEKTTIVSETQNLPSKCNEEEMSILLSEKVELERDLKDLSDKLSVALSECNANNELAHENAKMAQDAITGWEKAEAHALSLKEDVEEALERKSAYEERALQLEAALKECMQQLRFNREEQEQRIHDVVSKLAKDYDEKSLVSELKLSESDTKIAELQSENTALKKIIFLKEKLLEELNQKASNTNADMKELMNRLQSTEKRNTSLKYEVQVLEKELQIRNEEKDFNQQTSSSTHKLHLENVKKIAKLESECERLRVLVRKRLPGPSAMTRMKNEVRMLERSPAKKNSLMVDKLHALEEDNNALRMKLAQAEAQFEELSKTPIMKSSDFGCDDKASCAWSSASTMISELTTSYARSLEINLMDDFVEMEKLALVCDSAGKQLGPLPGCQSGLNESISKLIQIIEKFNFQTTNKESSVTRVHDIHVFQWKSSEVAAITQSFLHVCYGLLNGEVDIGRFFREVGSTLEWIINHCISLQDESTMKDAIKNHFGWESGPSTNGYKGAIPLLHIQSNLKGEIGNLKEKIRELESAKKEVEEKLEAMIDDNNSLSMRLQNKKLEYEDLSMQLSVAKIQLDDASEKLLSLQAESEYKTKHSEELKARCNELQIQLESTTSMDIENVCSNVDGKQLQTNWDVTSASEKLAQCQETIFSLGKQLNAMQECQETIAPRTSLLDKLLEEDNSESRDTPLKPPPGFIKGNINPTFESDWNGQSIGESGFRALPLVPMKKKKKKKKKQRNAGLLKKLVWRKRKGKINKLALVFSTC